MTAPLHRGAVPRRGVGVDGCGCHSWGEGRASRVSSFAVQWMAPGVGEPTAAEPTTTPKGTHGAVACPPSPTLRTVGEQHDARAEHSPAAPGGAWAWAWGSGSLDLSLVLSMAEDGETRGMSGSVRPVAAAARENLGMKGAKDRNVGCRNAGAYAAERDWGSVNILLIRSLARCRINILTSACRVTLELSRYSLPPTQVCNWV